jgi:amidase
VKTKRIGLFVAAVLWAPLSHGQIGAPPFQIMETTIDQVHAAYKSGKLTAHQLVQGYLDRIQAYDQQRPQINAIITLNPKTLEEADGLDM